MGLLLVWMLAGLLGHVLFLFLVSAVIAFLLNPLVRDLQRIRLPRGAAVAFVLLLFAAAVAFIVLALGSVVVDQTRSATNRIDDYVTVTNVGGRTGAEQDIDRLQHWLDTHGLQRIQIQKQATNWVDNLGAGEISTYTQDEPTGVRNTPNLIMQRARMEGFLILDYLDRFPAAQLEMAGWVMEGRIQHREHVVEGLEHAGDALNLLFSGGNTGKVVVAV